MPNEVLEVVPDNTVDAPNPQAEYESYVARRQAETTPADTDPTDDTPEPEPEPAASEPATPAAEVTPQPEASAPASEPGTETQEEKVEREKKAGIPQSRFDEVTRLRREAERDRDAEREKATRLERELAELKAKPAEPVKAVETTPAPTEVPKPVLPDPPTLEDKDGDWDAYQAATKEYFTKTLPEFQEKLTDWKADQRDLAKAKAAKDREEADAKAKTDAAAKTAREAEELFAKSWNERFEQVKTAHPDIQEKINKTPGSAAMISAMQDSDNGTDLLVWLTDHPDEAKRIGELTGLGKTLNPPEMRRAIAKAHLEFAKIDLGAAPSPPAPPDTPPVAPPAAAQPSAPPVNPKPAVSRAPKPPAVLIERSNGTKNPKDAAEKGDFALYEELRRPQVRR